MKKLLTIIIICTIKASIAQVPNIINFQAQAVNSDGSIISKQAIKTRLSILDTPTGAAIYSEVHSATTSAAGLIGVGIGNGSIESGDFNSIKWEDYPKYIKVEIDLLNGAGYKLVSTSQLVTVPYSFFSAKADTSLNDSDNQELIVNGNQLSITNGNTIQLSNQWESLTDDPNLIGIKYDDGKTGEYEFSNGDPTPGGVSVGLTIRNKKDVVNSWSFLNLVSSSTNNSANQSFVSFSNPYSHYTIGNYGSQLSFIEWSGSSGSHIFSYTPGGAFNIQRPLNLNSEIRRMGIINYPINDANLTEGDIQNSNTIILGNGFWSPSIILPPNITQGRDIELLNTAQNPTTVEILNTSLSEPLKIRASGGLAKFRYINGKWYFISDNKESILGNSIPLPTNSVSAYNLTTNDIGKADIIYLSDGNYAPSIILPADAIQGKEIEILNNSTNGSQIESTNTNLGANWILNANSGSIKLRFLFGKWWFIGGLN
ncbi:MAG: hypothetical protein K8H85_05425 [Cyclobacteriaceae bacterium]|nr:hypothetical protein [Cyclobacteriaceae bacterium]